MKPSPDAAEAVATALPGMAILADVRREVDTTRELMCPCDDYDNCQYDNN